MVELGAQAAGETLLSGHIAAVIRAEGTARGKAVRSPYECLRRNAGISAIAILLFLEIAEEGACTARYSEPYSGCALVPDALGYILGYLKISIFSEPYI
jgi:hypothetical protein